VDSRHDYRSLGAVVAGTARWASQHYRSRISHGFQKLPTYIYTYIAACFTCVCARVSVCGESLRRLPAAVATSSCANREKKKRLARGPNVIASDDILGEGALRLACVDSFCSPISFVLLSDNRTALYKKKSNVNMSLLLRTEFICFL